MSLPLAAVAAVFAALIETSVLPELRIAGVQPDLVLVLSLVAAMIIDVEDGLALAFVGGVMLDLLTPGRPLGATTLSLLAVTGVAILVSRVLGAARWLPTILAVLGLSVVYHALLVGVLAVTAGVSVVTLPPQTYAVIAALDVVIAAIAALVARSIHQRYAADPALLR